MGELAQSLAPLGIGGVLAGVVIYFHFKRDDEWRTTYASLATEFRTIVQDNTKVMQSNTDVMQRFFQNPPPCNLHTEKLISLTRRTGRLEDIVDGTPEAHVT